MTQKDSLRPWDIVGYRRAGLALLHGPLRAIELAERTGEDWRNANRRINEMSDKYRVVEVGPGSARERLLSLAKGEPQRVRAALEQFGTGRESQPGRLAHGQTIVTAAVAPDVVGAFKRALERQASATPPLWGVRVQGREADWMLVFDDEHRADSETMMDALRAAGASCASVGVSTVMTPEQLMRQLAADREASRATERG